ncbi:MULTISPECIES: hypothetical protein [unclassified Streptomyces]|uniref:hypothetical protein n=1 Tax=unclassified Streptomyces TaxID=2593676 RepID=UPI002E338661|nr:hypothetical protein [Streptomyces sp. NBC_01431]
MVGTAGPYWSTPCSTTETWTPPGRRPRAVPTTGSGSPSRTARRTRPADVLAVYLRLIEPLKQRTGDRTYQQMARLLLAARECHQNLGTQEEFAAYLTTLRADQKRKRNLMKTLDEHGL